MNEHSSSSLTPQDLAAKSEGRGGGFRKAQVSLVCVSQAATLGHQMRDTSYLVYRVSVCGCLCAARCPERSHWHRCHHCQIKTPKTATYISIRQSGTTVVFICSIYPVFTRTSVRYDCTYTSRRCVSICQRTYKQVNEVESHVL